MKRQYIVSIALGGLLLLSACDSKKNKPVAETEASNAIVATASAEVLPYLNIQEQPAKIALPFCETKDCIDLHIQTIHTVDSWLNQWIEQQQAKVLQDQIGLKQVMQLQQAVDAYIRESDLAQEAEHFPAYDLEMYTRIPYQRNQYVLLQIGVNRQQKSVEINDRYYFFVADRKQSKAVALLEIIEPKQQVNMDQIIQTAYEKWRLKQSKSIQEKAPKKLYWGQADWFFDQEGLGLHYRSDEVVEGAAQLDIYLTKEQTQQVLKVTVYEHMF